MEREVWEVEVCGQGEAKEQERRCCPRTRTAHQSETAGGSQSSVRPHCTAGRAGQHLGEGEEVKQTKNEEGRRGRKSKRRLKNTGSKGKKRDRDRNSVSQDDLFAFDIPFTHT